MAEDIKTITVRVDADGRIAIPNAFLRSIGLKIGQEAMLRLDGDKLILVSPKRAIRQAQALVRKNVPRKISLVKQLIAERRAEARIRGKYSPANRID